LKRAVAVQLVLEVEAVSCSLTGSVPACFQRRSPRCH